MLVDGLIEELTIALHDESDDDRRRHYRLTKKGLDDRAARGETTRHPRRHRAPARSAGQAHTRDSLVLPQEERPPMIDPVPEDFHTITPQLVVKGVAGAIDWYTRAFGAHELLRNTAPDGTSIMHAELLLGDSRFFVVDEFPGLCRHPRRWAAPR